MNDAENALRKRLAIFLPGLYDGGAERVMLNLAAGLVEYGFDVDLVLAQAEGPFLRNVPASVRIVELNSRHLSAQRTLFSLPSLVRYLRSERPDAMLSSLNYANIIALWAKRLAGVPLRLSISEHNTFSREREQFTGQYRWLLHGLMRQFYPRADTIIAVSEGVADDLASVLGIPHEHIKVIYNPVITPELQTKKEARLEHPWFGKNQPPVVLAAGRLTKQKGFDVLIRAFAEVRSQRVARLLILGEGEDRSALIGLLRELDLEQDVGLPGFVSNPYSYMANASLFVLSSRWEGLPTVLVEAIYCGAPIISTDCPSGPREILKNGEYGQLVPVDDIGCLAQAINTVLDGKTLPIPQKSWQAFTLDTVLGQYVKTLLGTS
jgi:glycosyltransferase involved in cell wall biosynthesis